MRGFLFSRENLRVSLLAWVFLLIPDVGLSDALTFIGGDTLKGNLIGIHPKEGVEWQYPGVEESIRFDQNNVGRLVVERQTEEEAVPVTSHYVKLTNGDVFAGDVVALDEDQLTLETDFAGAVSFDRSSIARVSLEHEVVAPVFDEAMKLADWKRSNKNSWKEKDGAFYSAGYGTVGKKLELPERFFTEFDIAWETIPYVNLYLCTKTERSAGSEYYQLMMNTHHIQVNRVNRDKENNNRRNTKRLATHLHHSKGAGRLKIAIGVDRIARTTCLVVNGELMGEFVDADGTPPSGNGVVFNSYGNYHVRLANLRISEWDGTTPGMTSRNMENEDRVRLKNGDVISGRIESVKDGQLNLKTGFADLSLNLKKVIRVQFATQSRQSLNREAGARIIYLDGGSRFAAGIAEMNAEHLLANTEGAGYLEIKSNTVSGIRFVLNKGKSN